MTQLAVNISYVEKKLKEFGVDEGLINELKGSYQDLIKRSFDTDVFFYNFLNKKLKEIEKKKQQGEEVGKEAEKLANFTYGLIKSGLVVYKDHFGEFVQKNLWPYCREFQKTIYTGFKGAKEELVVNLDINDVEKKLREAGVSESLIKEFKEAYQDLAKDAFDNDHVFFKFIERKIAEMEKTGNYTAREASRLKVFVDKLIQLGLVDLKFPFEEFSKKLLTLWAKKPGDFNEEEMKQVKESLKKQNITFSEVNLKSTEKKGKNLKR